MKNQRRAMLAPWVLCAAVMASACGGGDGDGQGAPNGGQGMSPTLITGTVAAGLPLTGTVTVKDAAGESRTMLIGTNGQYAVEVIGMTPPFLLRAEGNVGGNPYVIHSGATTADIGGTVNITPLTDLVVANVAGQIASTYFDQGQFASMNKAQLDAEAGKLREKLLPMLLAIGVDGSIDLLRTPFTPLASALDTALDQIRIDTDPVAGLATITNLVTQQSLQDDLAVKAAQEVAPATMNNVANLNSTAADIPKLRAALLAFSAKFATGLPPPGALTPLMSEDFLDRDRDRLTFANELVTQADLVGAQFTNVVIESIDYAAAGGAIATVGFEIVDAQGRTIEHIAGFGMKKLPDGTWRVHGDGRVLDIDVNAHAFNSVYSSIPSGAAPCLSSGVNFSIQDADDSNNGGDIASIRVRGPGLPAGGAQFTAPPIGGLWQLTPVEDSTAYGGNVYIMTSTCVKPMLTDGEIAALPAQGTYTLTAYTSGGVKIPLGKDPSGDYRLRMRGARPYTLAELKVANFPTILSPSFSAFSGYTGGDLSIAVTGLHPQQPAWVWLYAQAGLVSRSAERDLVLGSTTGSFDATLTLNLTGAVGKSMRVSTTDGLRRSVVTGWDYFPE